jgi:hypothetical protein
MSRGRIVGSHFRADGKPKTGYTSERVAKQEAARFGMTHYRCDFCDRFHLTSSEDEPPRGRGRGSRP